jgi:GxxExxY protein
LKAIANLGRNEEAQVIHYLRATGQDIGFLANFGSTEMQFRRFVNGRADKVSA